MPVDDVTLPAGRQFADVKVSNDQLRDLVSDSHKRYVYAISSSRVSPLGALNSFKPNDRLEYIDKKLRQFI